MFATEAFEALESSEGDLDAWCRLFGEGQAEVSGGAVDAGVLASRLCAEAGDSARRWVARETGRICAVAEVRPQRHDPAIGFLRLFVAPQARRRGIGSALLAHVVAEAAVDRVQATVLAGSPGEPFVRGWRMLLRLELHEQRLDQDALQRCQGLAMDLHPDYQVVHWRGAVPAPYAPSFARVMAHVLDAPGATLQMAPRAWDTAAVRAWEAEMGGQHVLVCAVVHTPSDEIVGATVTTVPHSAAMVADQHDTAVLPEHRGRGLAHWMKARQTLRLHESFPKLVSVTVTVNQKNAPMLSVNRAVGYRIIRERLLVEMPTRGVSGGVLPNVPQAAR